MRKLPGLLASLLIVSSSFANESPDALQQAFMEALIANDAQALSACYADDAVNFPVDAMMGIGPESAAESWNRFFAAYKVISAGLSDDHLETHGDTAIAWGLFSIIAEPAEGGEAIEMKGRYMDVARNIDGSWLYVADHASMPLLAPED